MKAKVASLTDITNSWRSHSDPIIVGKDILELLSSSMYIDPMSLYREYIQNAADAIDEACSQGILSKTDVGRVFIDHDITPCEARRARVQNPGLLRVGGLL